uniref:Uncharacterized protein n=1 Tax=Schistocephalus solidus TaxID=70667 RepID=A0A0V0JBR3_SCHSO
MHVVFCQPMVLMYHGPRYLNPSLGSHRWVCSVILSSNFTFHRLGEVSCYSDQHVYQVKLFRAKAVELGISFLSMTIFTRFIGDSLSTGRTQSTWPLVGQFTSCTLKDLVEPKVDRWFLGIRLKPNELPVSLSVMPDGTS